MTHATVKIIVLFFTMALGSCLAQEPARSLSHYIGRDLRKLGTNELKSLGEVFKAMTGEQLGEKLGWAPWSLDPTKRLAVRGCS